MSFISPFFLFAVSAAVLPILYHLIRKMRAKKVMFSSLLFLKATPKELIKKRRLRDIILLIVRACILGLLAFAFARPFIPQDIIPFISRVENKSVVILVDNSYSMQYEDLFDKAKEETNRILDDAGPVDEFSIVVFSDKTQKLTDLSADISNHRYIVDNVIEVSNSSTDFYQPLVAAEEILKDAIHEKREIILISDLQNYAWSNRFENWNLKEDITFTPIQVSGDEPVNSYIEQFNYDISRSGEKSASEYYVQVAFQQKDMNKDYPLGLWDNGDHVDNKNVETTQSDKVIFQQIELKQGAHQGYVSLEDDKLNIDNRFYFSYEVDERPSILCIEETGLNSQNNAFFLETAFNIGDKSDFKFTAATRNDMSGLRLEDNNLIFVANVSTLSARQLANLKQYAEDGGTVVISFGERTTAQRASNYLSGFGIGTAEEVVELRGRDVAILEEYDPRHPIFSLFVRTGRGDLYVPIFTKYMKIIADTNATVIATLNTGDPLLVERKTGAGKVLAFTSTFDRSWTELPMTEIYVPLVYQIAKYAINTEKNKSGFLVGGIVTLKGKENEEWEISAPGDNLFKVTLDETGTGYFRDTYEPGNYIAASIDRSRERFSFSVNVDMRESDLELRDPEEVYAAVSRSSDESEADVQQAVSAELEAEEKRQKFWRYVILFILALFMFETFYANRHLNIKTG
ncbi:VWA domain-containing protein [candidate division KSB1 bacterium]|nr:VWA domain-containing protein [candidate division KSB1 bacterium]